MHKNPKELLLGCTVTERKLYQDLIYHLSLYKASFIELLDNIQINVSYPLRLVGSVNDLLVVDNDNHIVRLSLFRNCIKLIQPGSLPTQYSTITIFDSTTFAIEKYEVSWPDNITNFFIDLNDYCVVLRNCHGDTLSILFEETVQLGKYSEELIVFCMKSLNHYISNGKFDTLSLERMMNRIAKNNYFCIWEQVEASA